MIKYLRLKPNKINVRGRVQEKYAPFYLLKFSKYLTKEEPSMRELWIIKDGKKKIEDFLEHKYSKPRFQAIGPVDGDIIILDNFTGQTYPSKQDAEADTGVPLNQNDGVVEQLTKNEALAIFPTLNDEMPEDSILEVKLQNVLDDPTVSESIKELFSNMLE